MKKNKFLSLLLGLVAFIFISPVVANAKTVNVYFFRSSTCPHCQEAQAFFEELQQDEEYKDLFVIKDYEVSSKANVNLMEKAIEKMGNNSSGAVPYIIIGDEAFLGYSSDSDDDLKEKIKEVYADDSFVDPLADIINDSNQTDNDNLIILGIFAGAIVLIVGGLYFARKDTTKLKKAIEKKEKKNEEIKEEKIEAKEKEVINKTTAKKTNTTKKNTSTNKANKSSKNTTKKTSANKNEDKKKKGN